MGKGIDFKKALFYTVLLSGSFVAGIILTEMPSKEIATQAVIQENAAEYVPSGEELIDGKVNINAASEQALQQLEGIGEKLSKRIVEYRSENGAFASVENLMDVPGIGYEKFKEFEADICIGQ